MESKDLKNIFSGYVNIAKKKFGLLSSSQLAEGKRRFDICSTCVHNINDTCKKCGCPLATKTLSPGANCPDNKW